MKIFNNIVRKLIIYLSFPDNLKDEILSAKQLEIIDDINLRLKKLIKKNTKNKLETHKIFSENVFSIIYKKDLKNFLRKPFIQKMFFVHNRFYNAKFLNEILNAKVVIWRKLLIENKIGNPVPFFLYKNSSGNRIRHVFLLKKIFDYCNIDRIDSVFEIGGGYGCMAKILNDLDEGVNYTIFDLAEVNLLQYYYLKSNNLNFQIDNFRSEKLITSKINILRKKLNFLKKNNKKILIIANWSLSEMPINLREELEFLFEDCDYGLISYQSSFENISNEDYFINLGKRLSKKFSLLRKPIKEMNSNFNRNNHYKFFLKKF